MSKAAQFRDGGHIGNTGYLDGLRGICCLLVVIDHCIGTFKPDLRWTGLDGIGGIIRRIVQLSPLNIVYNGSVSVYIFFILSGYVLSIKFFKHKDSRIVLDGVIKRIPRLMLPVLSSMIFMYLVYSLSSAFLDSSHNPSVWGYIYDDVAP